MAVKRTSQAFKDISLSFTPHPVTKDLTVLNNERAIVRSVRNLVETIPTERFFNSSLGTDVRASLFENFYPTIKTVIKDQIIETIERYEPRVENLQAQVDPGYDMNTLNITVFFEIRGIEAPAQQFSFLLEPTR